MFIKKYKKMHEESRKKDVVDSYGNLAKVVSQNTCQNRHSKVVSETIGYSKKEIENVPDNSNLGVGCGNPSALAKIVEGETVIDLGSGAGFDAFLVSPKVGVNGKIIGIDLSDDMLSLARKNAKKGNIQNVEFRKGDIEKLPVDNEIANHIISNCVINLSTNKQDVFNEAYRVLKPNGNLSISDVVLIKELPNCIQNSIATHVACLSGAENIDTYIKYVKNAGFKDVTIESRKEFPIELMLADPQIKELFEKADFDIHSEEAKLLASSVVSIALSAKK